MLFERSLVTGKQCFVLVKYAMQLTELTTNRQRTYGSLSCAEILSLAYYFPSDSLTVEVDGVYSFLQYDHINGVSIQRYYHNIRRILG